MNNKGSVRDVLLISILFFGFSVGFLLIHFSFNETADIMMNNSQINGSADFINVMQDSKNTSDRLDYLGFAIFMGFVLSLIITSFLVSGHPLFMFIFLVVDIIVVVVASVLSFVWNKLAANAMLSTTISTKFPITNHLLDNFPIYITIVALLSLGIMYAKPFILGDTQ